MGAKELQHIHRAAPVVLQLLRTLPAQALLQPGQHCGQHRWHAQHRLQLRWRARKGEPGQERGRCGGQSGRVERERTRRHAGENVVHVTVDETDAALQRGEKRTHHTTGDPKRRSTTRMSRNPRSMRNEKDSPGSPGEVGRRGSRGRGERRSTFDSEQMRIQSSRSHQAQ